MNDQLKIYTAVVSGTGFEIVVLLVSRPVIRLVVEAKESNKHDFIPDRRIYSSPLFIPESLLHLLFMDCFF